MSTTQEFQFVNSSSSKILLVLEPGSSEFWIKKGASIRLLVIGSISARPLDVEYLSGGLVIYNSGNEKIEVYENSNLLAQGSQTRRMAKKLTGDVE